MRILALLTDGFGGNGGIAHYNIDLMTALSLSSSVESVCVLPRFGSATCPRPDKIGQWTASSNRVAWSLKATTALLLQRFDVIFCGHLNAAPLAAMLARLAFKPLWLQAHGIEAWSPPRSAVFRDAVERARLVTVVSRYTRKHLLSWSNIDPALVRVLPNTVSPVYSPGRRLPQLVARHRLAGKRIILTVGRLASTESYKGHDRIIQVLPDVLRFCPQAAYLIVGSGDDRVRLEALARKFGVSSQVLFTGEVNSTELPDYYRLADLYAMPSTGEGFGIVFLEAAVSGLSVIGGDRDGSADALADGALGRLINPKDRAALVEAIIDGLEGRLLPNPAAAARFSFPNFVAHVDKLVRNCF